MIFKRNYENIRCFFFIAACARVNIAIFMEKVQRNENGANENVSGDRGKNSAEREMIYRK